MGTVRVVTDSSRLEQAAKVQDHMDFCFLKPQLGPSERITMVSRRFTDFGLRC